MNDGLVCRSYGSLVLRSNTSNMMTHLMTSPAIALPWDKEVKDIVFDKEHKTVEIIWEKEEVK